MVSSVRLKIMARDLVEVVAKRLDEEAELLTAMLELVPRDGGDWRPPWPGFTMSELAAHIEDAMRAVCVCFVRLELRVDAIGSDAGIAECRGYLRKACAELNDADLARVIPTHFVPQGQAFLDVLLGNWKHVHMHMHQLFLYLKLMGIEVGSEQLYRFVKPE